MPASKPRLFWVANIKVLEKRDVLIRAGFRVPGAIVDDYAFLEAVDVNKALLRKSEEYGVEFLTEPTDKPRGSRYVTVTELELERMYGAVRHAFQVGRTVQIVSGVWENLTGTVLRSGDPVLVRVDGLTRAYNVQIPASHLVPAEG